MLLMSLNGRGGSWLGPIDAKVTSSPVSPRMRHWALVMTNHSSARQAVVSLMPRKFESVLAVSRQHSSFSVSSMLQPAAACASKTSMTMQGDWLIYTLDPKNDDSLHHVIDH